MPTQIQVRKDTAANWATNNPILLPGEFGHVSGTGLVKIGDGVTSWNNLLYVGTDYYALTANGSAVGPTIANFFSAGNIVLPAASSFDLEYGIHFTKTTAGTVTFTLTNSQAPVNMAAYYVGGPVTGVQAVGAPITAAVANSVALATVIPVTSSLTTAVNHQFRIRANVTTHATIASKVSLQVTSSAGTITPLRGSFYTVRAIPANVGAFVA